MADIKVDNIISTGSLKVTPQTVDASDNASVLISGGGDTLDTRGGNIGLYGNEHATQAGKLILSAGSGNVEIIVAGSTAKWKFDSTLSGSLLPTTNEGVDIGAHGSRIKDIVGSRTKLTNDGFWSMVDVYTTSPASRPRIYIEPDSNSTINNGVDFFVGFNSSGRIEINGSLKTDRYELLQNGLFAFQYVRTTSGTAAPRMYLEPAIGSPFSLLTFYVGNLSAGNSQIVVNGTTLNVPFTGCHIYPMGFSNPQEGDAVKLVNRKIEICDTDNDPTCVGILTSELIISTDDGQTGAPVIRDSFQNEYHHDTNGPHTLYHVAAVGDSKTDFLSGAKICDSAGPVVAGDYLTTCAMNPGCLRKQASTTMQNYTVAQAVEDVVFDVNGLSEGNYVYLKK